MRHNTEIVGLESPLDLSQHGFAYTGQLGYVIEAETP